MSDADDTPILPAHTELHLCMDGTLATEAQDATMGTLSILFDPDKRLQQSIDADASGFTRLCIAHVLSTYCKNICLQIAQSAPDDAVLSTTVESADDTEIQSEEFFEESSIICFGDNRMPSSWTYGIYIGTEDERMLFQGIHTIGRLYKGSVPLTAYVIKEIPVPFSGIDGLVYASTIFEMHDDTFYEEAFSLIQDEAVLRDIVLDKECTIKTACIAIKYIHSIQLVELLKEKTQYRGKDLVKAYDARIRALRAASVLSVVNSDKA